MISHAVIFVLESAHCLMCGYNCRCGHTVLLAHAKAVQLYRLKYQQSQEGRISMVISAHWGLPFDPSSKAGEG
jgi:hypothetical protein